MCSVGEIKRIFNKRIVYSEHLVEAGRRGWKLCVKWIFCFFWERKELFMDFFAWVFREKGKVVFGYVFLVRETNELFMSFMCVCFISFYTGGFWCNTRTFCFSKITYKNFWPG
jgi:hypothetical protein